MECYGRVTLRAMLLDSVAPLVKMISLGSAPIRSATCCSGVKEPPVAINHSHGRKTFNPITKRKTYPNKNNNNKFAPNIQLKSLPFLRSPWLSHSPSHRRVSWSEGYHSS